MAHLVLYIGKFDTLLVIGIYAIMLLYLRTNKTMSHLKTIGSVFFPVQGAGLRTRLCSFAPVFSVIVLTTFWLQRDGSSRINLSCVSLLCHYMHFQYMGWILQNNG